MPEISTPLPVDLPAELWIEVFKLVNNATFARSLVQVSRRFRAICLENFRETKFEISGQEIRFWIRILANLEYEELHKLRRTSVEFKDLIRLTPLLARRAFVEPSKYSEAAAEPSIHPAIKNFHLTAEPAEIATNNIRIIYQTRSLDRSPLWPETYCLENATSPPTQQVTLKQWCPTCIIPPGEVIVRPNVDNTNVSVLDVLVGLKKLMLECYNSRLAAQDSTTRPLNFGREFWPEDQQFPEEVASWVIAQHPYRILRAGHLANLSDEEATIGVYIDCPCRHCNAYASLH
ncbi:hypothetical protein TWF281_002849 [Arthrobotrys megalospora]